MKAAPGPSGRRTGVGLDGGATTRLQSLNRASGLAVALLPFSDAGNPLWDYDRHLG